MSDIKKEIKIITGSCKRCVVEENLSFSPSILTRQPTCRLLKDVEYYQKEIDQQKERIDHMKTDGADPYDIKKQVFFLLLCSCLFFSVFLPRFCFCFVFFFVQEQVLQESESMIPTVEKQFQAQLEKLTEKLVFFSIPFLFPFFLFLSPFF